jgi:magnesium-transporting ATPase (P-type)
MDSFGALALATSRPHDALLNQSPNGKETSLISRFMIHNIAGQSVFQIALIGIILVFPCGLKPHSQHHYTLLYTVFVLCQMFNLINARATEPGDDPTIGLFDTPLFFGIMIGVGLMQFILVQIAEPLFSCTPLNTHEWLVSIGLAALTLPTGFLIRRVPVKTDNWKYHANREDNQRLLN